MDRKSFSAIRLLIPRSHLSTPFFVLSFLRPLFPSLFLLTRSLNVIAFYQVRTYLDFLFLVPCSLFLAFIFSSFLILVSLFLDPWGPTELVLSTK